MDSDQQFNVHVSIQKGFSSPPLQQCNTCCSPGKFHCPFCSPEIFKPTNCSSLKVHLDSHRRKAFNVGAYTIHRCKLGCRSQPHYHCLYCTATVIRKGAFHNHLSFCHEQQQRRARKLSRLRPVRTKIKTDRLTPGQRDTSSYSMDRDDDVTIMSDSQDPNSQEASSSKSRTRVFPRSKQCGTVRKIKRNLETETSKCHRAVQTETEKSRDCDEYYFMTLVKVFKKLAPQKKAEVRLKMERLLFEAEFV